MTENYIGLLEKKKWIFTDMTSKWALLSLLAAEAKEQNQTLETGLQIYRKLQIENMLHLW